VGSWAKEGVTCYGIVVLGDGNGLPKKVIEIQATIVSIQTDKIIMKSLDDFSFAPVEWCSKISIKKGETWNETEGELFLTREEAIQFIDTNYPSKRLIRINE